MFSPEKKKVSPEPGYQMTNVLILWRIFFKLFYILHTPRQMFQCKAVHKYSFHTLNTTMLTQIS